MKRVILYRVSCALILAACSGGEAEDEAPQGSIYGVITDKATGEPIQSAGVQLSPGGTKTVTGSEGQYEFTELDPSSYTISVEKTGYANLTGHSIEVADGKTNKGDVQLEILPGAFRITNDERQDISVLDFGNSEADVTRSFNIFNDGVSTLDWEIVESCEWITSLSKVNGALAAGATQAVVVAINRDKLVDGANSTMLHIISNNGNRQLSVQASALDAETGGYITLSLLSLMVQKVDISASNQNWNDATSMCANSISSSYDDWRLPTIDELTTLYMEREAIGGFLNSASTNETPCYWSSSLQGYGWYYVLNFTNGARSYYVNHWSSSGSHRFYARCVRTIP